MADEFELECLLADDDESVAGEQERDSLFEDGGGEGEEVEQEQELEQEQEAEEQEEEEEEGEGEEEEEEEEEEKEEEEEEEQEGGSEDEETDDDDFVNTFAGIVHDEENEDPARTAGKRATLEKIEVARIPAERADDPRALEGELAKLSMDGSDFTRGATYRQKTGEMHLITEYKCSFGYKLGCPFRCRTVTIGSGDICVEVKPTPRAPSSQLTHHPMLALSTAGVRQGPRARLRKGQVSDAPAENPQVPPAIHR